MSTRCEGYRRYGGAFTLGPVKWEQCRNDAIVTLEVEQEDVRKFPACKECWQEGIDNNIKILSAVPINEQVEEDVNE